ncbi:hypothetical protein TL16_g02975 [Triparma laevis f. inornata]|uniref:Uncharacterized protein n=2 Tax=Triparma laevis TaxID=1534972 RepID=A0A9W7DRP3_9STRA|nr:hypothetical protein TrLO_g10390 [Triparma laevis f. longispina]GMH60105.1 hypothetical protein TL16_g02975 [Triparma laevis f. inornata]
MSVKELKAAIKRHHLEAQALVLMEKSELRNLLKANREGSDEATRFRYIELYSQLGSSIGNYPETVNAFILTILRGDEQSKLCATKSSWPTTP